MGYYIHSCKKMKYKGDYRTQQVLDYDTQQWHLLDDEMRMLMDKRKWVSIAREEKIKAELHDNPTTDSSETDSTPTSQQESEIATRIYTALHPTALSAQDSGLSVLALGVPGAMSLTQLQQTVDLDAMKVRIAQGAIFRMRDLVSWDEGDVMDAGGLKGIIAEFAACVGPRVAREGVLDFGRG